MAPIDPVSGAPTATVSEPSAMAMRLWGRLSQGEQLALAGALALVVIGEWLFGDLLGLAGVPLPIEVAAAELALLVVARALRPGTSWPIPYPFIVAGFAAVVVVPTISDLLSTLHNTELLGDGANLLAAVVDWVAAAAVGVGAWMVWRRS